VLLSFAFIAGRNRRIRNQRAQRIVLASATFEDGKLMVLPDGTLPMKTITDTFSERVGSITSVRTISANCSMSSHSRKPLANDMKCFNGSTAHHETGEA
jgi:hypothetical protein